MENLKARFKIHPLADVLTNDIGENTTVWQYVVILPGAKIGNSCNINCHTFIENDVQVGNNVTLKPGVFLWDGMRIEDNVFVGPNVTFTNDPYPRSKQYPDTFQQTFLKFGCSIGANATILGGLTIGKYAMIGAGSVVTKDVPDFALVMGNPARITGWLDKEGNKLRAVNDYWVNNVGDKFKVDDQKLVKL